MREIPRDTAASSVSTTGRSSRSTHGKRSVRQCLPDLPPGHDQAGQRSMAACRQGKGTVTAIDSCSAETDDKVTFGAWLLTQRSEEHTSELQSLMRISYAVFCLKKKKALTNTQ